MVDEDIAPEDLIRNIEREEHVIVARSADPDRESRSINIDDVPSSNNEIDNHIELHNKRKYYEIRPTKTIDYLRNSDEEIYMSSGFGDRLDFRFPGEGGRVPVARALTLPGPRIRPTAVQPNFATINHNQGRQNTEIQNIITGIVKLLNGNVNVQANSQLLNGRPGRPMASRINNRGPPRVPDLPPLAEFDNNPVTPPMHAYHPTKTPPPYPFDRPPHHGVNLPEQIVPPLTHRPGFHRPLPPWQRPRPRPPTRRPNPGLPMYKPLPPIPPDLHDLEDKKPEDELTISENETSHLENNIHHEENVPLLNLPETNSTEEVDEELTTIQTPETTSTTTTESTTSTTTTTTTTTEATTTSKKPTTTTKKPTTTTEKTTTEPPTTQQTTEKSTTTSTTEKPKTEKLTKPDKDKKKDIITEKDKNNRDKYKIVEEKATVKPKNDTNEWVVTESSMSEIKVPAVPSLDKPTPTEGLLTHYPTVVESSSSVDIVKTSINSLPLPSCKLTVT